MRVKYYFHNHSGYGELKDSVEGIRGNDITLTDKQVEELYDAAYEVGLYYNFDTKKWELE